METEAAGQWNNGLAAKLGNGGVILVLCGTPSGFAIFSYDGIKLLEPNACQNIWVDFADLTVAKRAVALKEFQAFGDKFSAITSTGVSDALADMIKRHIASGQKLAVENEDYKNAIENSLKISCLYDPTVEELMWGLKIQVPYLVPAENPDVVKEDLFPMSEGMKSVLNFHSFKVKPDMMVTRRIIELAGVVYECDRCVNKHNNSLRSAAEYLTKISHIDTHDWDLMKLATALKMVCYPKETVAAPPSLFSKQELVRMSKDAHKYESKILKEPLLVVYDEMYWARNSRLKAAQVLSRLLHLAAKAQEPPTDHKISPDGEKERSEHRGFGEEAASTECNDILAECKKRQIPPTLAPIDALKRYTCISCHPLHRMNEPGILSMHIHPSKDIVATGGIDTNVVLFDRPSGQTLCTLTGHSKRITSLKFVNRDELFITGSADKTVRIWRGSEDGNYSCIHILKDHTAEVEAVTVHATQKYLATASKDNTWCLYDISTGSCLTQVREASEQKGYTSATFHPNSLLLGTGTTTAVAKIWDMKTESNVAKLEGHVGPVAAISFSENGYHLVTAALDGVRLWDARKLRSFRTISSTPANAVEFDLSGSYLAVGGSDTRVYQVDKLEDNVIKTLPDLSGTGKVTSLKFGAGARYIAVGSMDCNLRIFGLSGDEQMDE